MIINGGVYEVDGKFLLVLGLNKDHQVEVCEVQEFDPNFYGEGDARFTANYYDYRLEAPEKFSLSNLKGHKTFLLNYLLEHKSFARRYDLSKFINK